MTREAAVLEVPTISVYQDQLLEVDRFLIANGSMIHRPNLDADFALRFLEQGSPSGGGRTDLLEKGRQAFEMIKELLLTSVPSRAREA